MFRILTASLLLLLWTGAGPALPQSAGKKIFLENAEPSCALCHTLKDAGASGEVGPNLDELKPDLEKVRLAVKNGVGNMPPYGDSLSAAEIAAVARYVAGAVKSDK